MAPAIVGANMVIVFICCVHVMGHLWGGGGGGGGIGGSVDPPRSMPEFRPF